MEGWGGKGNKAREINKGEVKNEKNGEKGKRRMEGVENQPTENTERKRISERRGRVRAEGRRSKRG